MLEIHSRSGITPTRPGEVNGYNDDVLSLDLLQKITQDLDFKIPDINLDDPSLIISPEILELFKKAPPEVKVETLTTRKVGGAGVFDAIMESVKNHLKEEFEANRIIGAEYSKTYTELTGVAIQSAVQFCLQKDSAYWTALGQQVQAVTGAVQLAGAKVQLAIAQAQAHTTKAQYAGVVLDLGIKDAQFDHVQKQIALVSEQIKTQKEQTNQVRAQTSDNLEGFQPVQGMIGAQTALYKQQEKLSKEQTEATRAQTADTRSDGPTVVGSIGKQKALYDQQIDSYKKDAKLKASKVFSDAWVAMKSTDEGLTPPTGFQNSSVDSILSALKKENGL